LQSTVCILQATDNISQIQAYHYIRRGSSTRIDAVNYSSDCSKPPAYILAKCSKYGSWLGVITSLGIIVSNRYPMLLHVRSECVISECWTGWCRSLSRSRLLDISREHKGKVEYISNRRVDGTCACFRVPWLCGFVVAHGVGSGSGCSDASG
jgi:hypothetical protein